MTPGPWADLAINESGAAGRWEQEHRLLLLTIEEKSRLGETVRGIPQSCSEKDPRFTCTPALRSANEASGPRLTWELSRNDKSRMIGSEWGQS